MYSFSFKPILLLPLALGGCSLFQEVEVKEEEPAENTLTRKEVIPQLRKVMGARFIECFFNPVSSKNLKVIIRTDTPDDYNLIKAGKQDSFAAGKAFCQEYIDNTYKDIFNVLQKVHPFMLQNKVENLSIIVIDCPPQNFEGKDDIFLTTSFTKEKIKETNFTKMDYTKIKTISDTWEKGEMMSMMSAGLVLFSSLHFLDKIEKPKK